MKLSMLLPPRIDKKKWTLAHQSGVTHAITKATPELSGKKPPYDFVSLAALKNDFEENGFTLLGLEGDQFDMSRIKLGLDGRDEDIENYCRMIENMGTLNIRLLCWNFMAVFGWFRTRADIQERGGAITTAFNLAHTQNEMVDEALRISEENLWNNLEYFLNAVIPVAEKNNVVMALHPDDPPLSPLKGVGRILTSIDAINRVLSYKDSPNNSIAFCQATFSLMRGDIKTFSKELITKNRVPFIHIRDIEGSLHEFRETFPDNGKTPTGEMLKHYYDCGFNGILRPDHVPAMYGETTRDFSGGISAGYEITGAIYAVGYIKGLCEGLSIPLL